MPTPCSVSEEFSNFCGKIGLREENIDALWGANIKTPHEIGSCTTEKLQSICDNAFLINSVYPVLQKNAFPIAMAKNPFEKALAIIMKTNGGDEPMDTSSAPTSTASDATGFRDGADFNAGTTPEESGTTFDNRGSRFETNGGGRMQSTNTDVIGKKMKVGDYKISINGGNFVQSNILGQGNVTYNNTNTVINSSNTVGSGGPGDLTKLRSTTLKETFLLNGTLFKASDIAWMNGDDFWIDGKIQIPDASESRYKKMYNDKHVYSVRNPGQSRALIINNFSFRTVRRGADRDTDNMYDLLTALGFTVVKKTNLTAAAILQTLREFVDDPKNRAADMFAVYIGSHGERDAEGKDTFLGLDGHPVKFEEVKAMFSSSNPYMSGKPKIFFLQFCRQESAASDGRVAAPRPLPATSDAESDAEPSDFGGEQDPKEEDKRPMDFLCAYATLAGSKAYRDTLDGSWFVTTLVKVLKEGCNDDDLLSMLTKVNNAVSLKDGKEGSSKALQISEVVHNLRRKIVFWPGLN